MRRLKRFFQRSGLERRIFFEAWLLMIGVRVLTLVVPFRRLEPYLGKAGCANGSDQGGDHGHLLLLRWAVESAARHVPWSATCLPQALVAKLMLRRRRVANTLYLGVAKDQRDASVKAHAWLQCADLIVVGYEGVEDFSVLTAFADLGENDSA